MRLSFFLIAPILIAAAPTIGKSERAQIIAAAGFASGKTCATGNPGWPKSTLDVETVDLNGDGKPEAFVNESNSACYGNTGSGFTIVGKDATGKWRKIGGDTGIPVVLRTRRSRWSDIRVGGPGFGKMPVLRWNGNQYR